MGGWWRTSSAALSLPRRFGQGWRSVVSRRDRLRIPLGLGVAFLLAQALFALAGVRFTPHMALSSEEVMDPALLRHHLWQTLLYLHAQPPLYNLFIGLWLKVFGTGRAFDLSLHVLFLLTALVAYVASYALQRRLGVGRGLAYAVSTALLVSPAFVLYENLAFYTLPVATLLLLASLALHAAVTGRRPWPWVAFFGLLFLLCGVRSTFVLPFYLAVALLLAWVLRRRARAILLAALPFGLLVFGFYAKNAVVFGQFTDSSWMGMNLAGTMYTHIPTARLRALVAAGRMPAIALVPRFSRVPVYAGMAPPACAAIGAPILTEAVTSVGRRNLDNCVYLGASQRYLQADLAGLRACPACFVYAVAHAWYIYFRPAEQYHLIPKSNRAAIAGWIRAWPLSAPLHVDAAGLYLRLMHANGLRAHAARPKTIYPWLVLTLVAALASGVAVTLGGLGSARDDPRRIVCAWLTGVVLFVGVVSNIGEVGDNMRFRFATDPLSCCLLGVALEYGVGWARRRLAARARGPLPAGSQP